MEAAAPIPEAWQSASDDREAIPGCTKKYNVAGTNVYVIDEERYVSTGGVLKLSPWGRIDHVPRQALAYGGARGSFVGLCCDLYDTGDLDWEGTDWAQTYSGIRMNCRPYVEAYATWRSQREWSARAEIEVLVVQKAMRTFGYIDRRLPVDDHRLVIDLKTSAVLTDRERLQVSSYLEGEDTGLLLQLQKNGTAKEHWLTDVMVYRKRFAALAEEAHRWIEQQEARR